MDRRSFISSLVAIPVVFKGLLGIKVPTPVTTAPSITGGSYSTTLAPSISGMAYHGDSISLDTDFQAISPRTDAQRRELFIKYGFVTTTLRTGYNRVARYERDRSMFTMVGRVVGPKGNRHPAWNIHIANDLRGGSRVYRSFWKRDRAYEVLYQLRAKEWDDRQSAREYAALCKLYEEL